METSAAVGAVLVGGATIFPDFTYTDQPVNVGPEQVDLQGSSSSTIFLTAAPN